MWTGANIGCVTVRYSQVAVRNKTYEEKIHTIVIRLTKWGRGSQPYNDVIQENFHHSMAV
jgi:hypothetical protein